jgi:hypothetical protein
MDSSWIEYCTAEFLQNNAVKADFKNGLFLILFVVHGKLWGKRVKNGFSPMKNRV